MSVKTTDLFQINGQPMVAPDEDVGISWQDLDSDESGRDEAGNMHRTVIKYDVGTWSFSYSYLTQEELSYLRSIFPKSGDFQFTHPDVDDNSQSVTVRAYRSKHSISWRNAKTGLYRNYSFNIIEAGD